MIDLIYSTGKNGRKGPEEKDREKKREKHEK